MGIQTSAEAVERLSQKIGFTHLGSLLRPIPSEPKTIEITDVELTSWVNAWINDEMCFLECPVENFQIRFSQGKYITSARIFEPVEADITILGKVFRKDEKSIDLEFEKVYIGNLLIPFIRETLNQEAERVINKNLEKIKDLKIDKIEILEGKVIFEGILSPDLALLTFDDFLPLNLPGFRIFLPGFEEKISRGEAEKMAVIEWWQGRAMIPENKAVPSTEDKGDYWLVTIQIKNMFTKEIVSENAGQYKIDKFTGTIREVRK